jgi:hypothetical protein
MKEHFLYFEITTADCISLCDYYLEILPPPEAAADAEPSIVRGR